MGVPNVQSGNTWAFEKKETAETQDEFLARCVAKLAQVDADLVSWPVIDGEPVMVYRHKKGKLYD
jgi:hypothetical protein